MLLKRGENGEVLIPIIIILLPRRSLLGWETLLFHKRPAGRIEGSGVQPSLFSFTRVFLVDYQPVVSFVPRGFLVSRKRIERGWSS